MDGTRLRSSRWPTRRSYDRVVAGTATSAPRVIASALRDDLLDGVLTPGTRLTEESLSARFGTGRHTIRSGLQLLVSEGLLTHRRNKGIVVPPVTEERVDAICSYRLILEIGALRLALAAGADFDDVERAVERLESLTEDTPWRHVTEAHSAVHRAIVEASGNDRLVVAHRSCQDELNVVLATIRGDFSARRLAILHRDLLGQLRIGGDVALRALETDLELGGRAGLLLALRRQGATVIV
jgi:DNA-binding GntR family transcriptional regulator